MSLNTSYGQSALGSNTSGNYNTALGSGSLALSTSGSNNTAVGSSALDEQTTGNNNVAVGTAASLLNNGDNNVVVGTNALSNSLSGSNNVVVGNDSGTQYTSYNYNTLLGADTDIAASDVQYATAIGYGAVADASNTIVLGGNLSGSYPVVSAPGGFITVQTNSVNFNYPSTPPTLVSNNLGSYVKLLNNIVQLTASSSNNVVNITNLPAGYWYITINLWANSLGNGVLPASTFISFNVSSTNGTVIYNSYANDSVNKVSQPQFITVATLVVQDGSPSTGYGGDLLNHSGNAYFLSNGNGGFTITGILNGPGYVGNVSVNYIAIRIA